MSPQPVSPFAEPLAIPGVGSEPFGIPQLITLLNSQPGGGATLGYWNIVTVQGPTILRLRCSPDDPAWAAILAAVGVESYVVDTRLRYVYQQPPSENFNPNDVPRWEHSTNGCCYLHKAGTWYVWNPNSNVGVDLPAILIPVPNDEAAERYLSSGMRASYKVGQTLSLPAAGAGAQILALDFRRTAYTITNVTTKTALLGFHTTLVGGFNVLPLVAGQTMTVTPDMAPYQAVTAEAQAGAAVANGLVIVRDRI